MTLVDFIALLRKNIVLLVVAPLACAAAMAAYSTFFMPVTYTANTSIYAFTKSTTGTYTEGQGQDADGGQGITQGDLQLSQMLANDFANLAESNQLRSTVASNLGLKSLGGYSINISSATNSRLLVIKVTGRDPEVAPAIANEMASVLGETAVNVMGVEAANVVQEAATPAPRSGPPRTRYTLVAFAAGLLAAMAFSVLRDMLNTTVHDEKEIQDLTGFTVVGRFPHEKG